MYDSRGRKVKVFKVGETVAWSPAPEAMSPASRRKNRQEKSLSGQTFEYRSKRGPLALNGRLYRGKLLVSYSGKDAAIINIVALEDYVRGVVGCEIGSLAPPETLKAQAVIVRTYAFANRQKHGKEGCDVCDKEHCQVYGGVKGERPSIDKAVQETRGIVMISGGQPISTMYHATCGGMTSDNEKVFGGSPKSYLRRVKCNYCKGAQNYRWSRRIQSDILKKNLEKEGIRFSYINKVSIRSQAYLDRVDQIVFDTDRGSIPVKGTTFRRLFNLPSTTFVIDSQYRADERPGCPQPSAPSVPNIQTKYQFLIRSRILGSNEDQGPPQLVIQTCSGLRRITKPKSGWTIIDVVCMTDNSNDSTKSEVIKELPVSSLDTNVKTKLPLIREENKQSNQLSILGRGYGHQIGLCQAGALALGKINWSYRQILAFYYSKVALRVLKY